LDKTLVFSWLDVKRELTTIDFVGLFAQECIPGSGTTLVNQTGSTLKEYVQEVAGFLIIFLCHRLSLSHSSREPFINLSINGICSLLMGLSLFFFCSAVSGAALVAGAFRCREVALALTVGGFGII
jgi:hypothetical protein